MAQQGKREERNIYSEILNEEIQLHVYLPPSYTPLLRYSVLIAQDGKDYFNLGKIARSSETLFEDGAVEEYIIVGVPYKDVQDRRRKYHPSGEEHEKYVRFLVYELLPFIEDEYSTLELASARGLIGSSLGATVSLVTALEYPRTFGKIALQSPYVNDKVLDLVTNVKDPSLLSVYHVAGKGETEVETTNGKQKDFITPNRELNKRFASKSFGEYYYEEFDGDHKWTYWQPDIPKALKFLYPI
ncbi:alpha/beta hydrolase [Pseudalkalibacillus berkeleyi]|uniref:Esterase family protein n=1 Tax=Pseudalkalibacillus berkeleyi TaxID=1069813 RepID=A0ABS9GZ77_9BACL|nr:alpha/beta hydrolase-fold protein [Pseudalkalibacillus berkeleyi]MCF6136910.1 esterase family protein [Pseudalkalibacillus berkeleyi]